MLRPKIGAIYKVNDRYVRVTGRSFVSSCGLVYSYITDLDGRDLGTIHTEDLEIIDKQEVKQALRQAKQRGMV